jgi:tungstate transport system substrate-binding protein
MWLRSEREALAIGERGDADALLVHDRPGENKFVAEGYGIDRYCIDGR